MNLIYQLNEKYNGRLSVRYTFDLANIVDPNYTIEYVQASNKHIYAIFELK